MMGGLSYMTGPVGRPLRAGSSVNDIMGGMFGAIGVLAALRERDRTGRGQEVQSALFENCVFLSAQNMQQYPMTREPPPPFPSRLSAWSVYDVFTLKDDEHFIGAVSDRQFLTLCDVLDASDLPPTPPFDERDARRSASGVAQEARRDPAPPRRRLAAPKLEANGLPYAPIVKPEQLVDDPHLKASGGLVPMETDDGGMTDVVLLPITLGGRRRCAAGAGADRRTYRRDPRFPPQPARQALSESTHGPLPHRRDTADRRLGLHRRGSDAHRRGQRRRASDHPGRRGGARRQRAHRDRHREQRPGRRGPSRRSGLPTRRLARALLSATRRCCTAAPSATAP